MDAYISFKLIQWVFGKILQPVHNIPFFNQLSQSFKSISQPLNMVGSQPVTSDPSQVQAQLVSVLRRLEKARQEQDQLLLELKKILALSASQSMSKPSQPPSDVIPTTTKTTLS